LPNYVTGFCVPHKTGDFLPYIGNDVGVLESAKRNVVVSAFTARHNGIGPNMEDAMGRIAETGYELLCVPRGEIDDVVFLGRQMSIFPA
jgi:hypothetical protein